MDVLINEHGRRQQATHQRAPRVLVVDDYPDNAESTASLMRLLGCRVETAYSGPEALESVAEVRPDLVLLDLAMPGMSGFQVAAALRRAYGRKLMIVAVSAMEPREVSTELAAAGFDDHLVKPAEPEELQELIRRRQSAQSYRGS